MGVQYDVIAKSGAWFSYNATVARAAKMRQYLKDNPALEVESRQKSVRRQRQARYGSFLREASAAEKN
ncbi:MAG: hypothetical protein ACLRSW_14900 [Christensenellaceae bacterium]